MRHRRSVIAAISALVALAAAPQAAAQSRVAPEAFPSRVVRIFVQGGPGSPPDVRARLIGSKLAVQWGQPVVVENRPGAGGQLAIEQMLLAPPDGHTLLLGGQGLFVISPHVRKLPFDPLKDLMPVTQVGITSLVLVVNPAVPARSVGDLVALAKRNPGKLNAATQGIATTQHLALEVFNRVAGVAITNVPYKDGVGQTVVDLTSGKTDLTFDVFPSIGGYVKDGRLRALAVTGAQRLAVLPDVPTFSEAGFAEIESVFLWAGFFARAGTPEGIVTKLHRAVAEILALPDVRASLIDTGATPVGNRPEEFAAFIRAEHARYGKLIAETGIKLD